MKVLAVIPARGGSKGVPRKNLKLLKDHPLLYYTALRAKQSALITKVVLSTDDLEIIDYGKGLGIDVPFQRPAELSTDTTPTLPVLVHAVNYYKERGELFDAVCILQPTSPFRAPGFIDEAIRRFKSSETDSLVSVVEVPHEYNPHWVFFADAEERLTISTGEKKIIARRQELPKAYHRDGAFYITKTNVLTESASLYGDSIAYLTNEKKYLVNIDTPGDWIKAEEKIEELGLDFFLSEHE